MVDEAKDAYEEQREWEWDTDDDVPLALRASSLAGSDAVVRLPRYTSSEFETGVVRGAGQAVKVERPPPDARTIVKRVHVSVPLLKAVKADNALLDLLLNSLITAKVKWA